MYEMQGTLSSLTAPDRPVTWLSLALRTTRQCQAPALGAGFPAPPASRGNPRMMPVSNGECISTASAGAAQDPATISFLFFRYPHGYPQNDASYSHAADVVHGLIHKPSTDYRA
jgi:hypothetical protein